jgi:muramoyltetrapeptide carboxypeptidase
LDRGYNLKAAVAHVRLQTVVPVLNGLPFGHVRTKVTLPVGLKVNLVVQGKEVLVRWG